VVGGVATLYGAIPGGLVMVFVPYYAAEYGAGPIASVVNGALLIVIMFLMPGGIIFGLRKLRNFVVRVVPRPPVLHATTAAGEVEVVPQEVDMEADTTVANPLG
jgi:branched-chain amino acid transport system permease protein